MLENFNNIDIVIEPGATNKQSLAQKETAHEMQQRQKLETAFLSDKGVIAFEKTFNSKIDNKSIRALKEMNNV